TVSKDNLVLERLVIAVEKDEPGLPAELGLSASRRSRPDVGLQGLCSVDEQSGGLSFGNGGEK
ncbi:MAG: hypothetical protein ACXVA6_21830, partial [Isosphaeraceae bacterium]